MPTSDVVSVFYRLLARKTPSELLLLRLTTIAALLIGMWFLWSDLALTGMTWDEHTDYGIAKSFATTLNIFANQSDPSQGRLPHIIGGLVIALAGPSLFWYKAIFATMVTLTGIALLVNGKRWVSTDAALWMAAIFFTNGYVLGSARASATAGDSLVMISWALVLFSFARWASTASYWPWGMATAAAVGMAIGSKWSSAPLLAIPVVLLFLPDRHDDWRCRRNWWHLIHFGVVALCVACVTNPLFLQGPKFMAAAWRSATGFYDHQPLYRYFDRFWSSTPWFFAPVLLAAKMTPPVLAMAGAGVIAGKKRNDRASTAVVFGACFLIAVAAAFGFKNFQSGHYYVGAAVPIFVLAGFTADFLLRSRYGRLVLMLVLAANLVLAWRVRPDFLQLGSEYGPSMQGEFSGPAINHCQGGPMAVNELVKWAKHFDLAHAYVLHECLDEWRLSTRLAFDGDQLPLADFRDDATRPLLLAIARVFHYHTNDPGELATRTNYFRQLIAPCEVLPITNELSPPGRPYELYFCR